MILKRSLKFISSRTDFRKRRKTIGVVTGIVGQKRYTINLKGEANHAGTHRWATVKMRL
ncbi:hypothetical protein [Jeotgalicoccus sp. WY2]|uniref:hypothetical protein n=1 Tax=Jeotgalicoccus sp. WY2 TaxID=2708346 RepID=UPI00353008D4